MLSIKNLLTLGCILIVCIVGQITCCPDASKIKPCTCTAQGQITCSGDQDFDIKKIFSIFGANGPVQYTELILSNSAITKLEDNVFGNVSFKKFSLIGSNGLKEVSKWALNGSAFTCEEFKQIGSTQLTDDHSVQLFEALSSLVAVNRIYLELTHVTKVPDNAFKIINGRQTRLESIHLNYIGGRYGSLQSIGNKAFYYLDNLKSISVANQPITLLKAQAFDFEATQKDDLDLHLEATKVTGASFEAGIFLHSNRPVTVEMSNNNIEYLDEKVFKPVFALDDSKMVTLIVEGNPLLCDCRMAWIMKDKERIKFRLLEPSCKEKGDLWTLTTKDFINCNN